MSLGETNMRPTAMLFRNLVSMDVEESIRANPLHVCPEAAVGGNLALVQDDDFIELDVESRRVHLDVSQDELERRRTQWQPPVNPMKGGYQQLYVERVMKANTGADLDFLTGCRGNEIPRESH